MFPRRSLLHSPAEKISRICELRGTDFGVTAASDAGRDGDSVLEGWERDFKKIPALALGTTCGEYRSQRHQHPEV
jgi:hypothetical protein